MNAGASDRQGDVLRVAAGLFRSRGYQGTSMDDIAKGVGLNKGTLYHYVSGKSGILFAIYREAQERALAKIAAIPEQTSPEAAVGEVIRIHLRSVQEHPNETAVYFQEMRWIAEWFSEDELHQLKANERAYVEVTTKMVQRGVDKGYFDTSNASVVAACMVGLAAWTYQWFDPAGPHTIDEVADVFVPLVLKGLVAESNAIPVRL